MEPATHGHGPTELLYKMKLERIKELRLKSVQLEKVKTRLLQEVEETESEEERMKEYHNEMELLNQEKMAHVEELRQIHADINAIENVVKHAEQDRNRAFESACQAYQDYMALKGEIDSMRNVIGLDMLPHLSEDDGRLTPNYFRKRKSEWQKDDQNDTPLPAPLTIPTTTSPSFQLPSTSHSEERPPFRQQPPPMKNCLSCHQQIHRNAPICPLCKAKSRSRNPKKPKRKLDTN